MCASDRCGTRSVRATFISSPHRHSGPSVQLGPNNRSSEDMRPLTLSPWCTFLAFYCGKAQGQPFGRGEFNQMVKSLDGRKEETSPRLMTVTSEGQKTP